MDGTIIAFTDAQHDIATAYRDDGYTAGLGERGLIPAGGAAPDAATGALDSPPAPETAFGVPRKATPRETVRVAVPDGALTADQFHAIARAARHWGDGEGEVTAASQAIALRGLAPHDTVAARATLADAGLDMRPVGDDEDQPRAPARSAAERHGHVGLFPQERRGWNDVGVAVPVGRLTAHQMDGLALIARGHGSGRLRLTARQNVVVPDVPTLCLGVVVRRIRMMGLDIRPATAAAGLVVCTGAGPAAAELRAHGLAICRHLDRAVALDTPIGIQLAAGTQGGPAHARTDIRLGGVPGAAGAIEGYAVTIGEVSGDGRKILEAADALPAADLPGALARLLNGYLQRRAPGEAFPVFARRHDDAALRALLVGAA